jgi:hypothetical protein
LQKQKDCIQAQRAIMYTTIRYGPVFGSEDLIAFIVGLIIFILIISMIESGVMVLLKWDTFKRSLTVSLRMNAASTIFGMGGVLMSVMGLDKFSIWLVIAIAFLLSVLIEGGILMLSKRDTPRLNWTVSLIANVTSYLVVILPLAWIS